MNAASRKKLKGHLNALLGLRKVLDDYAKRVSAHVIDSSVVDQVDDAIAQLSREFSGLAKPFDKATFFAHDVGRGAYFKVPAIQSFLALAIGQIEAALEEDESDDPVVSTRDFAYVNDLEVRAIVQRDYLELQRAYVASCWKSVIILAGGAIEALLMQELANGSARALAATRAPKTPDISRWDLADLIEVAVELGMVGSGVNKLSHSVREFRNLVHAGNEIRSGLVFGQEEARIALEVLNIVDRELSR